MSTSIGSRFLFSVAANLARSAVSLVTGLLVARGLAPQGYGELTFLLASFVAIRALLDLGSSNAFFTFISKARRDRAFYALYCGWLALQFAVSLLLVAAIFPDNVLDRIWVGLPRERVLLALVASFLQQQVWNTVAQIGEAARLTWRVQSLGLGIAIAHLAITAVLLTLGMLDVPYVLAAIITENALAALLAVRLLRAPPASPGEVIATNVRETLGDYWRFCRPLMLVAAVGFLYDFADKWFLQKFAGAGQQGFYQVAAQLSTVSLLATTSILNIFWKEVAHAGALRDRERLAMLYTRVTRGLVLIGAAISGFLIPWARPLVELLLGAAYVASWPILALMLLYPIHQSMGQINATMFMAGERTQAWMALSVSGQLLSLPVTYLLLAPTDAGVPGLALGALGLALKMVVFNALFTNVQAMFLASHHGWRFRWLWQLVSIGGLLLLGLAARTLAAWVMPGSTAGWLAAEFALAGVLYVAGLLWFVRSFPALLGCERQELRELARRFLPAPLARLA